MKIIGVLENADGLKGNIVYFTLTKSSETINGQPSVPIGEAVNLVELSELYLMYLMVLEDKYPKNLLIRKLIELGVKIDFKNVDFFKLISEKIKEMIQPLPSFIKDEIDENMPLEKDLSRKTISKLLVKMKKVVGSVLYTSIQTHPMFHDDNVVFIVIGDDSLKPLLSSIPGVIVPKTIEELQESLSGMLREPVTIAPIIGKDGTDYTHYFDMPIYDIAPYKRGEIEEKMKPVIQKARDAMLKKISDPNPLDVEGSARRFQWIINKTYKDFLQKGGVKKTKRRKRKNLTLNYAITDSRSR